MWRKNVDTENQGEVTCPEVQLSNCEGGKVQQDGEKLDEVKETERATREMKTDRESQKMRRRRGVALLWQISVSLLYKTKQAVM